jgi:hypothetical protein
VVSSRTKPGTRKLSEVARHVVQPEGIVSTGYPAVQAKCRDLGIVHDDWQQGLGRLILGKRADGKYAATVGGVVMSIPRQVGKTFTVGSIIFALCILFPRLTVLWTAHHTRTSDETFQAMYALSLRRKVAPHVASRRRANGQQAIKFRNGSRIMFGAREQGFGRGFAEVDVEVFDEAQILNESALEDMVAATNQAKHPAGALLFYMGTPPRPKDPGEAFANKRKKALSGASKDMVYVELSADPDADPDDRTQWAKANPSYPTRTPLESMQRLRENVGSDESWFREGLGVWDEGSVPSAIDPVAWAPLADPDPPAPSAPAFGVATAPDGSWTAIAVAWRRPDGIPHVMLADYRPGSEWVAERAADLRKQWGGTFTADTASRGLIVKASEPSEDVQAQAHTALAVAVAGGQVRHSLDAAGIAGSGKALNASIPASRWKPKGNTRTLVRRGSADISPLVAAALAVHGLTDNRGASNVASFFAF